MAILYGCDHDGRLPRMLAEGLTEAFQLQAGFCRQLGSPLYGELLSRAGDDLGQGGMIAEVMDGWVGRPVPDAVVLRLMGAVHRLVLRGDAPLLARFYPSAGGTLAASPAVWTAFLDSVGRNFDYVRDGLTQQVQTNEVSRCAALLAGFLHIAHLAQRPLRLLEIGSSAGLNLSWDRYRYERQDRHFWGNPDSPVTIVCDWHGEPPALAAGVEVISRAGCDIAPLDVSDKETALRLQAFVWPEQLQRLEPLRAAIQLTRQDPPSIAKSAAPAWLEKQLSAAPQHGVATVVFHSVMWWYMSHDERDAVTATIEAAGARADVDTPLAWLQMELTRDDKPELRLRFWPGGEPLLLGHAHAHGREVWWQARA